ncbi:MAG: acyltransferase domain-containing protein [Armatimonadota bacterium]
MEASTIELDRVLERLDITEARPKLEADWEASQSVAPEGVPFFLEPAFVARACEGAYIPQQFRPDLLRAAERIAADEAARALAWHAHWCMFASGEVNRGRIRAWPRLTHSLGPEGGLLYLLAVLSGIEGMQRIHAEHDIPEPVVADTMSQIALYLRMTAQKQGYPEVIPHLAGWLMNHLTGNIYRLARLQFQFGRSHYRIRVFRDDASGQVVALSEPGVRFRPDGQVLRDGDEPAGSWEAVLVMEDAAVTGNPILPQGRALAETVTLPRERWRAVFGPGTAVLHLHIPGGEPMHYDQCGAAFERALEFFPRHFPDYQFHAFTCGSWILDTALQQIMPETSNLVRFQREVYLFPIGMPDDSLARAIFDEWPIDLASAPRDTSMRRAYLDAMASGGLPHGGGGCFLLPEDVRWGEQVYLSQEWPW